VVNKRNLNPGESPMAFCGAYLRARREEAGWTLEDLGLRVFTGSGYLAQIERAERKLQPDLGRLLDREFDTGTFFFDLATALRKASPHADYFVDAAELEKSAKSILEYVPATVPGMLQTEAYARAVIEAADPHRPVESVNDLLAARLERADRLTQPGRPAYWAVLPEWVLRTNFGGPATMAEQGRHLVEAVRQKRAVLQVFPQDSTVPAPLAQMVSLMEFADAPPVVYFEAEHTGQLIDDRAMVARYRRSYDLLRSAALSPAASLELIQSVARGYDEP
jgi:transcriptional regulator with XRE-family HTH domain